MKGMKKRKSVLSLLLAFLLAFGMVPVVPPVTVKAVDPSSNPTGSLSGDIKNIHWKLQVDETVTNWDLTGSGQKPYKLILTGSGPMWADENTHECGTRTEDVPWKGYMGYIHSVEIADGITSIGPGAFYEAVSLKTINIPDSIVNIGYHAFEKCYALENFVCGKGLVSIGCKAFADATKLASFQFTGNAIRSFGESFLVQTAVTSIDLPEGIEEIGPRAFYGSKIKEFHLPTSVTTIGKEAFLNPQTVTGLDNVTTVGSGAFAACEMTTIELPNLQTLGSGAFYSSKLESIKLPASLKSIKDRAFEGCTSLKTVTFEGGDVSLSIGNQAFRGCSALTGITLPDNVTQIGGEIDKEYRIDGITGHVFAGTAISSFTVPKGVQDIYKWTFRGCSNLSEIRVAEGNTKFQVLDGALCEMNGAEPSRLICYPPAAASANCTVPDGISSIDSYAFENSQIETLYLPNSVTVLGANTFKNSKNLTSVRIGNNIKGFATGPAGAFYGCTNLREITGGGDTPGSTKVVDGVVYLYNADTDWYTMNFYPFAKKDTVLHIAEFTDEVVEYAIYQVPALKEIYMPKKQVFLYGYPAFADNENLKSFYCYTENFPQYKNENGNMEYDPLSRINSSVFADNAPNMLIYVPQEILDAIDMGLMLPWEKRPAFWDPDKQEVTEGTENGLSWKFEESIGKLTVNGSVPDYDANAPLPWQRFKDKIQSVDISAGASIGAYAFDGYENLQAVSTPVDGSLTKIGKAAFANCPILKYVSTDSVTEIGEDAFSGDACLLGIGASKNAADGGTQWDLDTINAIGKGAFKGCAALTRMDLSDSSITVLPDELFSGCEKLERLSLPLGLTSIGENILQNCTALQADCQPTNRKPNKILTIPAGVSEIGAYAFAGCKKLIQLNVSEDRIVSIKEGTFAGCESLVSFSFPFQVREIGANAFAGCKSLVSLFFSYHLQEIGENAFKDCAALSRLFISENVKKIGANAFSGSRGLKNVYFTNTCPDMNRTAFEGCEAASFYYRADNDTDGKWAALGGTWNGIPLKVQDHFFTEGKDHYSFSNSASSFGYAAGYRIPRQRYVDVLGLVIGTYRYNTEKVWNGSCFGMASSTLAFYEDGAADTVLDLKKYDASAENLYRIGALEAADGLTKLIEGYHVSQYQLQINACQSIFWKNRNDFNGLLNKVSAFGITGGLSMDETASPVILAIYGVDNGVRKGHALVPLSWTRTPEGEYKVKVYDSNHPASLQTLTINKEKTGFTYEDYFYFTYIDYKDVAGVMSGVTLYSETENDTLYLSIDKKDGTVKDMSGNGIDQIENAHEDIPLSGEAETDIKKFILPNGKYTLASATPVNNARTGDTPDDNVTFYVASGDVYAQVQSSDETAALTIETNKADGKMEEFSLSAGDNAGENESVSITVVNEKGKEHKIDIKDCSKENMGEIKLTALEGDTFTVEAPKTAAVEVNGKPIETASGSVPLNFADGKPPTDLVIAEGTETPGNPGQPGTETPGNPGQPGTGTPTNPGQSGTETPTNPGQSDGTTGRPDESTNSRPGSGSAGGSGSGSTGGTGTAGGSGSTGGTGSTGGSGSTSKPSEPDKGKPGESKPDDPKSDEPGTDRPSADEPNDKAPVISVPSAKMTIGIGEAFTIKANITSSDAAGQKLTYKASNKKVTVSANGKVTGKSAGTSWITVGLADYPKAKTVRIKVTVKKAPGKISLNAKEKKLKKKGTFAIKVKLPKNTASSKLTFTSSRPSVAKVSSGGKVTALKKGTAVITVSTFNGKKARLKIIVS